MTLYDALYQNKFPHILTKHEQGAIHAADGYARSSGKVGVCFATSGPGAANLITGIATANIDSIPIVCITGQVATHLIGKDSFQEADVCGITAPVTKHNYLIKKKLAIYHEYLKKHSIFLLLVDLALLSLILLKMYLKLK